KKSPKRRADEPISQPHRYRASELLDIGPEIQLERPHARRLQVQLIVRLRDRVGIEHCIRAALGYAAALAVALDLAVDDDVGYVDALRLEFARHALRERAQPEFAAGKVVEIRAPAQAGGRAGEEDRAAVAAPAHPREHRFHGFAPDQKSAEAGVLPAALEFFRRCLQYAFADECAGIVDDEPRRAELAPGLGEEPLHRELVDRIAADGDGTVRDTAVFGSQRLDALALAHPHPPIHLRPPQPPR